MFDRIRCATIISLILGIGFAIGGILLFTLGGALVSGAVKKGCQLIQGTPSYKAWHDPPVPLEISFYVFNINNPAALNNSGIPNVTEIGPFVYKEVRTKADVRAYENETISYRELRSYEFLPGKSVSNPNTTYVTTMNIVYMALVNYLQMEGVDRQIRVIVGEFLSHEETPTMMRTVHEFLWGYEDTLLKKVKKALPEFVASDVVSVYNASVSGAGLNTFIINNGIDVPHDEPNRINKVGNIEGFNGQSTVSYWSNDYANMINGTDSTIWHPNTQTTDEVYIFSSDICRSLRLEYQNKYKNPFGIENYHFVLPKTTFDNSLQHQDFCLDFIMRNRTHKLECLPNGLMSLSTCVTLSGSSVSIPLPIIASFPHFLDADSSVQQAIDGLQPDDGKHRSFMDVEPMTGTVMNGARRMQVNLNVINDPAIGQISKYRNFVFPMIWLQEHAQIDKKSAADFHSAVSKPIMILQVLKYMFIGISITFFVIAVVLIIRYHHQTRTTGDVFSSPPEESTPLFS